MGTENQILKGTKWTTNAKKAKLKIKVQSRGQAVKNTVLKIQKKITKITKYIFMKFALKIGSFFASQQQVIKMKIKGVIKDEKIKEQ